MCKVVLQPSSDLISQMGNYSINHANLTIVFTTSDHVPTLLKLKSKAPTLRMIVAIDEITADAAQLLKAWADSLKIVFQELPVCGYLIYLRSCDLKSSLLLQVEAYGKANYIEPLPASPELVVSICYTSVNVVNT